jgi:thiol:disulfide interchange protein
MARPIFTSIALTGISFLFLVAGTGCSSAGAPAATAPAIRWEAYSDSAFARAKAEKKLVVLDLEAVWCHWCHVQDEVTYADPKVARLINAHYVAVKVDQDSRPDLAGRYEDYGWPATIILEKSKPSGTDYRNLRKF